MLQITKLHWQMQLNNQVFNSGCLTFYEFSLVLYLLLILSESELIQLYINSCGWWTSHRFYLDPLYT